MLEVSLLEALGYDSTLMHMADEEQGYSEGYARGMEGYVLARRDSFSMYDVWTVPKNILDAYRQGWLDGWADKEIDDRHP